MLELSRLLAMLLGTGSIDYLFSKLHHYYTRKNGLTRKCYIRTSRYALLQGYMRVGYSPLCVRISGKSLNIILSHRSSQLSIPTHSASFWYKRVSQCVISGMSTALFVFSIHPCLCRHLRSKILAPMTESLQDRPSWISSWRSWLERESLLLLVVK